MAPRIYIDADACTVKDEAIRVTARHQLEIFIVSNGGIRPYPDAHVHMVIVPEGPDVADQWIAERAAKTDIVVTSDMPLAVAVIANGATVLRPNGDPLTGANIGGQLATRDLMADLRAADPLAVGAGKQGGRPFTKQDRSRFLERLEAIIRQVKA